MIKILLWLRGGCVILMHLFLCLVESCKLNNVDALFLPCDYVRRYGDGKDAEITKPSQTAA